MSLINEKDMEEFSAWAVKNVNKDIFPKISKEESYYIDRDSEETYMMEYSFSTMPELRGILERYIGLGNNAEMLRKLIIMMYQNKFQNKIERNNTGINSDKDLPEYIYVF